jgi:hypothetical protein
MRFREGMVPRDLDHSGTRVRCHLFDDEAMARAKSDARD